MKKRLVVLSGAGISAESGLQTFRGGGGLWEGHDVYEVASPRGWAKNPALVLQFYNERRKAVLLAQPNAAHLELAALEKEHDVYVITQNIDDLHERAGSSKVLHLHGEILKMRSVNDLWGETVVEVHTDILLGQKAPDGGQYRPHIVWFEEAVPAMEQAIAWTEKADVFLVVGTSLQVYPAAGLLQFVPPQAPVYLIDPHANEVRTQRSVVSIALPATTGMDRLREFLKK